MPRFLGLCLAVSLCLCTQNGRCADRPEPASAGAFKPARVPIAQIPFQDKSDWSRSAEYLQPRLQKLPSTGIQLFQVALEVANPHWQKATKTFGYACAAHENVNRLIDAYESWRGKTPSPKAFVDTLFGILHAKATHPLAQPLLDDELFPALFTRTIAQEEAALAKGETLILRAIFTDIKKERGLESFSFGLLSGYIGEGAGHWQTWELVGRDGPACTFTYIQLARAANKMRAQGEEGLRETLATLFPEDRKKITQADGDLHSYICDKERELTPLKNPGDKEKLAALIPMYSKHRLVTGGPGRYMEKPMSLYGIRLSPVLLQQIERDHAELLPPHRAMEGRGEDFHPRFEVNPALHPLIHILSKDTIV